VDSDKNLYMYYQARNAYGNNIPGWRYHGGERTVLAARFHGLVEGVPATIRPSGKVRYHAFAAPVGSPVPLSVELLLPDASGTEYTLLLDGRTADRQTPMPGGTVSLNARLSGSKQQEFHVVLQKK